MIIFINDDRPYIYWITHHRQGFVLDGKRKPKLVHLILHRATCAEAKAASSPRSHWTTGHRLKACSMEHAELATWAVEETGIAPTNCPSCQPLSETPPGDEGHVHLSKLASDILEYILEAALIHFEIEQPPYRLTVADIAACFGKTAGQISPVLHRLVDGGLVTVSGYTTIAAVIPPKRIVLPTAAALRTLEAFQSASDSTIEGELAKLEPG